MVYYNKIGALIWSKDKTKFMVVEKHPDNVTSDYIMPGGQFDEDTPEECLIAELKEEIDCKPALSSIQLIGEYIDVAAGRPDRDVSITLYQVAIEGVPTPNTEIEAIHWIDSKDINNERVSPIIRNKIIPDLVKRGLID